MGLISVLHSQENETKAQLFTRLLRGVLGGRDFTVGSKEKGERILKLWQRVLVGAVLFSVGLPYIAFAGAVLALSKPKNMSISFKPEIVKAVTVVVEKSLSDKVKASKNVTETVIDENPITEEVKDSENEIKAPIEGETLVLSPPKVIQKSPSKVTIENQLSWEDINALSYLFEETTIRLNTVKISDEIYPFDQNSAENYFQKLLEFNQPTLMKVSVRNYNFDTLIIPLEKKKDKGQWERSICRFTHHPHVRDQNASWLCGIDKFDTDANLPLYSEPNATTIQPYRDLMNRNVIKKNGVEFRLFIP